MKNTFIHHLMLGLFLLAGLSTQLQANEINNKKISFFEKIYPLIEKENISVLRTRSKILFVKNKLDAKQILFASEKTWLIILAKKYQLLEYSHDVNALVDNLLMNIDMIPPSLALAQSANESAWGESRFAQRANNYFGQWCFTKGCGLIPQRRADKSSHEVKRFSSVRDSVRSYIKNINTIKAYTDLRKIRHQLRLKNIDPNGLKLAKGLTRYSARGEKYVTEIQAMIKQNKLIEYDQRFWLLIKNINL